MEHGKLHIPVNGVDVDFYPETCFDDVLDTGTDQTLTQVLADVRDSINAMINRLSGDIAALQTSVSTLVGGKVDKTGDTLSGGLQTSANVLGYKTTDTSDLQLLGGTAWNKGAFLRLFGMSSSGNEGVFSLNAHNGARSSALIGTPNGALTWGGKEIERVEASGVNYIRYSSGLQICFGSINISANASYAEITLSQAFKDTNWRIVGNADSAWDSANGVTASFARSGTNKARVYTRLASSGGIPNYAQVASYIAIGQWK